MHDRLIEKNALQQGMIFFFNKGRLIELLSIVKVFSCNAKIARYLQENLNTFI